MPDQKKAFKSLPEKHQQLLRSAQQKLNIKLQPLQELVSGFSGAYVFLASVYEEAAQKIDHCILKLDRKSQYAKADEITRHLAVLSQSNPAFVSAHIPELAYDRVEHEDLIAIFYKIAGQSLLKVRPLAAFESQNQIEAIFKATNAILLSEWNDGLTFSQGHHPREALEQWLGFRLKAGANIEGFIEEGCQVNPETPGFLINSAVFPNPLLYGRVNQVWGDIRLMDFATGFLHRDLNTNNILVKFIEGENKLERYFLIDFALFKESMPLLYDQRYLEMSYLTQVISKVSFEKIAALLAMIGNESQPGLQDAPVEMAGIRAVMEAARQCFGDWVTENYPSLQDDLWGQYWLAGAAAGLSFVHKTGQPEDVRLAGLIYAAANLKRFVTLFDLPLPKEAAFLYSSSQSASDFSIINYQVKPLHNLPAVTTRFIGREREMADITSLVLDPEVRLVTLLGPGGTGKTRLSLQVAKTISAQFSNGVSFVPLVDETDASQMISRLAQTLEVKEGGRPLLESLKDFLQEKHLLLILDNFEQLNETAPILSDLLLHSPEVTLIVTSRIALNLQGEHVYHVPPLPSPASDDEISLSTLLENEAVSLFVDRAKSAQAGFSLNQDNAQAIVEICRKLDGLPLALELAAARIRLLPPEAILARLDNRLGFLSGGSQDMPDRHRTLRNTLVWSYDLLSPDEQALLARLSVFVGGFSLEAAEAVCGFEGDGALLDSLTALLDNSLIRREEHHGGAARLRMLETIREFAYERLGESEEIEKLQALHAKYYGGIAIHRVGLELYSERALHWLNWTERELANLRAVLAWSLSENGDLQLGTEMVFALIWFWYRRGYFLEGLTWVEKLLEKPKLQAPSPLRALALQSAGLLQVWKGDQDQGLARLEESLALFQRSEEERWIAPALMSNAVGMINMGRDQAAKPLLEQSQALFQKLGMDYFQAITLVHLGNVALGLGDPEAALAALDKAESLARSLKESWLISFVMNNLGEVARVKGDYDQARDHYEECMGLMQDTKDKGDMARFVHSLAYLDQHEDALDQAESGFSQSLHLFRRLGNRRGIAESLAGLAGVRARQGDLALGAKMLGAAENLLQSTGGAWWPADRVEVDKNRELLETSLGAEAFKHMWEQGAEMDLDQAIAFAANGP